jgi:phage baseplate assembly protein W
MGYVFENINPKTLSNDIALGVQFPMNYPAVFNSTYTTLEAVKTNIKNLLLTRKGERVMHPNFGSDLLSIIFEPSVSELKGEIQQIISEPISFWIPQVSLDTVETITAEDDPTLQYNVKITINFDLIETVENDTIVIFASENQLRVE